MELNIFLQIKVFSNLVPILKTWHSNSMYVCQWILNIVTQKEPGIPMKGSADVQTCLCRCLQIKLNDKECNESQRSWEDSWCEVRRSGQNWRQFISFSCECEEKVCGNLGVIKRRHAYALLQSMAVSRGRVTGPSSMGPYGQGGRMRSEERALIMDYLMGTLGVATIKAQCSS